MADTQTTLTWLRDHLTPVLQEARQGSPLRLGSLPESLLFYTYNVLATQTITDQQFADQYPRYLHEAEQLRLAMVEDTALREQIAALPELQAKLDAQTAEIETLKQAIAKLSAPAAEPQEEGESPAEPAAEGEATDSAEDETTEPETEAVDENKKKGKPKGK